MPYNHPPPSRLLLGMMRNSRFGDAAQAHKAAGMYSRLACIWGKSRRFTAFVGGIALHGPAVRRRFEDIQAKTLRFMASLQDWAAKRLSVPIASESGPVGAGGR